MWLGQSIGLEWKLGRYCVLLLLQRTEVERRSTPLDEQGSMSGAH
jgi:hypothetical protein